MAARTISRLIITPGKTITFNVNNVLTVTNFVAGDWSGTYANPTTLQSSSPGSPFAINAPTGVVVLWVIFSSCNATGGSKIKAYYCDDFGTYDSSGIIWLEKPFIGGHSRSMISRDKHARVRAT
jgi:hypothetical protein